MPWLGLAGSLFVIASQAPLVFPASTELVHVVVSVTDPAGQPVRGLRAEDFTISADGKERPITSFAPCADSASAVLADCPVDLALLLDTSESMQEILRRARDTAAQFVKSVPGARGRLLVAFDSNVRILPYNETDPVAGLDAALANSRGDKTRLFDAVSEGVKALAKDPRRRTIMVALTDGEDTGAEGWIDPKGFANPLDAAQSGPVSEVARALQRESITFHAISFADHLSRQGSMGLGELRVAHGRATLRTLANASGGLVVDGEAGDLTSEFARIRNDIAGQYVLGFVPEPSPVGRSHGLKARVLVKDVTVRHRLAYETKSPG